MRVVILITVVVLQIALPLSMILWLALRNSVSKLDWAVRFLVVGFFTLWLFRAGSWAFTSYYARYIFVLLFVAAAIVSLMSARSVVSFTGQGYWWWGTLIFRSVLIFAFAALAFLAFNGHSFQGSAVELEYPLRDGTYYIAHGGSRAAVNYHVSVPPQRYALDIVALDRFGRKSSGLFPSEPERFAMWGHTVYSPCSGEVIMVTDGIEDLAPPNANSSQPAGNHVWIRHGDVYIVLAHLMNGSITVKAGDRVEAGKPIGRVGNSGNTTEPHLHMHAVRFDSPPVLNVEFLLRNGIAVPMLFGGRFLTRNDVFNADRGEGL